MFMLDKCQLTTQGWITTICPSVLSSKTMKKATGSPHNSNTSWFSSGQPWDSMRAVCQIRSMCAQRLKWDKILIFMNSSRRSVVLYSFHCKHTAARTAGGAGTVHHHCTVTCAKFSSLPIISFANVKNSEKWKKILNTSMKRVLTLQIS